MLILAIIVFAIVVLFIQAHFDVQRRNEAEAKWSRVAEEMGLAYTNQSGEGPCIKGQLRGFNVCFSTYLETNMSGPRRKQERLTQAVVTGDGRIDSELKIGTESAWTGLKKLFGGNDVQLHDAAFDSLVHLGGSEPRILALMNHQARKAVLAFLKGGDGVVSNGTVTLKASQSWETVDIKEIANVTITLAEQLVLPAGATAKTLAENAFNEPFSEVRMRNLDCLSAQLCGPEGGALYAALDGPHPLKEETARAVRAALSDADPWRRLLGAMLTAGEEGFAALKKLSEDDTVAPTISARALLTLMARFPWERVTPIVTLALTSDREPVLTAAVEGIGARREVRLLGPVCALSATASKGLLQTIAKTLSALASADAEPTLLKMLEHDADEVQAAAARALGEVGTISAVEPLLQVKGKLLSDVKTTARQAARTIQGRLGDVESGRLSVVEEKDPRGALSLASEDGRLPLDTATKAAAAAHSAAPGRTIATRQNK